MTRLEAAVRSPISFRRQMSDGIEKFTERPETVGIHFDGRLFVWHALESLPHSPQRVFAGRELGPSVTSVLGDDPYEHVATELERFLTALVYEYGLPAEVVAYGSNFETDPYAPPIASAPRTHSGWMMGEPFEAISLRRDPPVLKSLAWYREAVNAGSPLYRFLAYWNCLEATLERRRAEFIDRTVPTLQHLWNTSYPFPSNPSEHFHELSRNAIAHVFRGRRQMIDPDADQDRRRLDSESRFLDDVARIAIKETFGNPLAAN